MRFYHICPSYFECYMLKQSVTRAKVVTMSTLGMKILTKFKQAFSV